MTTAANVITKAMRLFGIIDQFDTPTPTDLANGVDMLNDVLRSEHADGAAQYFIGRVTAALPAGASGNIYSFSIGTAQAGYLVQKDIVGVRAIWIGDAGPTVNRETRQAPMADIVRTLNAGRITKWHQERQSDGSVLVSAWQPPAFSVNAIIEYGGRAPLLTQANGGDAISIPPEGIHDISLLLGRRICTSYGRSLDAVALAVKEAETVDMKWKNWARGQQWMRLVRA